MRAAAESLTQLPSGRPAAVATLTVGAELPAFTACARDAWGNASAPAPALTCDLVLECAALEPASLAVPFSAAGVARVQGAPYIVLTLTLCCMCIAHGWSGPERLAPSAPAPDACHCGEDANGTERGTCRCVQACARQPAS